MKMEGDKLKAMARIQKLAAAYVADSAVRLQKRIQDKLNQKNSSLTSGLNPSAPGEPPANRTGNLKKKIDVVNVTVNKLKPTWRVGTNVVYARIQEFGGRIRPTKSKYLAVPVGPDGARAAKKAKGDLRSLKLHVVRSGGKLLLVEWKGSTLRKGAKPMKVLFVLVKSVFLPARPYFRPAIAEHRQEAAQDLQGIKFKLGMK